MSCNSFNDLTQILNQMATNTKLVLNQIQQIDIECLKIEVALEEKRQNYIQMLELVCSQKQVQQQGQSNLNVNCQQQEKEDFQLNQIHELQSKLKELTRQKIFKAEEINNQVDDVYLKSESVFVKLIGGQPIDLQYNSERKQQIKQQILQYQLNSLGLRKKKGRQKNINPKVQAIYEKYYMTDDTQQTAAKQFCICTNVDSQPMILCQNIDCETEWYHFQCVGLDQSNIPSGEWFCPKCLSKFDQFKKVKFFDSTYESQLIFVGQGQRQQAKKENEEEKNEKECKKGRGRPRKHPIAQQKVEMQI